MTMQKLMMQKRHIEHVGMLTREGVLEIIAALESRMKPLKEAPQNAIDEYVKQCELAVGLNDLVVAIINADRAEVVSDKPIASPPVEPVCKKFQAADEILAVARSSTMSDCDMALVQCLTRLLAELRKEG